MFSLSVFTILFLSLTKYVTIMSNLLYPNTISLLIKEVLDDLVVKLTWTSRAIGEESSSVLINT